jgi:hypothetical protein
VFSYPGTKFLGEHHTVHADMIESCALCELVHAMGSGNNILCVSHWLTPSFYYNVMSSVTFPSTNDSVAITLCLRVVSHNGGFHVMVMHI